MLALALCLVAAASAMRSIVLAGQTMCYTHGPDFKLSCFGLIFFFFFFFFA